MSVQNTLHPLGPKFSFPLARLSICPCGESTFNDTVTLGTIFKLYPNTRGFWNMEYRCGKCGLRQPNIETVIADILGVGNENKDPAPVPAAQFDWPDRPAPQAATVPGVNDQVQ